MPGPSALLLAQVPTYPCKASALTLWARAESREDFGGDLNFCRTNFEARAKGEGKGKGRAGNTGTQAQRGKPAACWRGFRSFVRSAKSGSLRGSNVLAAGEVLAEAALFARIASGKPE